MVTPLLNLGKREYWLCLVNWILTPFPAIWVLLFFFFGYYSLAWRSTKAIKQQASYMLKQMLEPGMTRGVPLSTLIQVCLTQVNLGLGMGRD